MSDLPDAISVAAAGSWSGAVGHVALDYEGRFLRRKRLHTEEGDSFMVDLPEVTNLTGGEAFVLRDGRHVEVRCAPEPVLVIRGDLARLAWHIGNRHTPCEITPDHLVIRVDHVLQGMLRGLGAQVEASERPFRPEGGAYGMGRTMGHSHGPSAQEDHAGDHGMGHHHHHDDGQGHGHSHSHEHDHDGHDGD